MRTKKNQPIKVFRNQNGGRPKSVKDYSVERISALLRGAHPGWLPDPILECVPYRELLARMKTSYGVRIHRFSYAPQSHSGKWRDRKRYTIYSSRSKAAEPYVDALNELCASWRSRPFRFYAVRLEAGNVIAELWACDRAVPHQVDPAYRMPVNMEDYYREKHPTDYHNRCRRTSNAVRANQETGTSSPVSGS